MLSFLCFKCKNGASCDSVTGACFCQDGFRGKKCSDLCFQVSITISEFLHISRFSINKMILIS